MKSIRLITTNSGDWGGSEMLWQQVALKLQEQGHRVQVSVPSGSYKRYKDRINKLRVNGMSVNCWKTSIGKKLQSRLSMLMRYVPVLNQYSQPFDVNVVSQGNLTGGLATLRFLHASNSKVIVVVHLVSEFQWPSDEVATQLAAEFRYVNLICFVSKNNLQLAEQQLGPLPNAIVVRNPFLVPFNIDIPFPPTNHGYILASVARLSANHKGFDLLIRVLDCEKWKSRDLTIHLFGDGQHKESLKRDIERRGLENIIIFRGHQNDIVGIWRECHGLILCSRMEGLPLALVEAMLSARCPIVTNVGGAQELVDDGYCGFLAKGATVHDIDDALERAWVRRTEWCNMGIAAARKARSVVPKDPAMVFSEIVLRLCQNGNLI